MSPSRSCSHKMALPSVRMRRGRRRSATSSMHWLRAATVARPPHRRELWFVVGRPTARSGWYSVSRDVYERVCALSPEDRPPVMRFGAVGPEMDASDVDRRCVCRRAPVVPQPWFRRPRGHEGAVRCAGRRGVRTVRTRATGVCWDRCGGPINYPCACNAPLNRTSSISTCCWFSVQYWHFLLCPDMMAFFLPPSEKA